MKKIVLIGYMGSGKTSLGKSLAKALSMPFYDLDDVIAVEQQMDISMLFKNKGEIYFRKKEAQALFELIAKQESIVIATGGGTPCYGTIMEDLLKDQNNIIIYLKLSISLLTDRLWVHKDQRPLIAHIKTKALLEDFIRKHLFERSYYYNKAHHILTVNEADSTDAVLRSIMSKLF